MRTASRSCEQDGRIIALDRCSALAPLMAMLRHRERRDDRPPATLLYSSRSVDDVIYRPELDAMAGRDRNLRVLHTLTRSQPTGWTGHRGRIDRSLLGGLTGRAKNIAQPGLGSRLCQATSAVSLAIFPLSSRPAKRGASCMTSRPSAGSTLRW